MSKLDASGKSDGIIVRIDECSNLGSYETATDVEVGPPSGAANCAQDYTWVWTNNEAATHEQFGWVTSSPDGSYILAAGVKDMGDLQRQARWLVKLDAATGAEIWQIVMPMDNSDGMGSRSGWETVEFTSDGGFVCGGWANKHTGEFPGYKSGGQVDAARPMFQKFSASVASQTTPMTTMPSAEWSYVCGSGNSCSAQVDGSAKGIRVFMDNGVEKVAGAIGVSAAIVVLNVADGTQAAFRDFDLVDPLGYSFQDVEPVFSNGAVIGYGVTGLDSDNAPINTNSCIAADGCGIIRGHLSYVSADLQTQIFNTQFNDFTGGTEEYAGLTPLADTVVLTECWGLTSTIDGSGSTTGLVAACGQGIEGCGEYLVGIDASTLATCNSDPRRTWRGAAVKTDLQGNIVWWRNDNHRAYEFVDRGPDGQLVFLSDKPIGFGFATYSKTNA